MPKVKSKTGLNLSGLKESRTRWIKVAAWILTHIYVVEKAEKNRDGTSRLNAPIFNRNAAIQYVKMHEQPCSLVDFHEAWKILTGSFQIDRVVRKSVRTVGNHRLRLSKYSSAVLKPKPIIAVEGRKRRRVWIESWMSVAAERNASGITFYYNRPPDIPRKPTDHPHLLFESFHRSLMREFKSYWPSTF